MFCAEGHFWLNTALALGRLKPRPEPRSARPRSGWLGERLQHAWGQFTTLSSQTTKALSHSSAQTSLAGAGRGRGVQAGLRHSIPWQGGGGSAGGHGRLMTITPAMCFRLAEPHAPLLLFYSGCLGMSL